MNFRILVLMTIGLMANLAAAQNCGIVHEPQAEASIKYSLATMRGTYEFIGAFKSTLPNGSEGFAKETVVIEPDKIQVGLNYFVDLFSPPVAFEVKEEYRVSHARFSNSIAELNGAILAENEADGNCEIRAFLVRGPELFMSAYVMTNFKKTEYSSFQGMMRLTRVKGSK